MTKKGIAMVEMKDIKAAENVLRYVNRMNVFGSQLNVRMVLSFIHLLVSCSSHFTCRVGGLKKFLPPIQNFTFHFEFLPSTLR